VDVMRGALCNRLAGQCCVYTELSPTRFKGLLARLMTDESTKPFGKEAACSVWNDGS
jgi:hypothetical protein